MSRRKQAKPRALKRGEWDTESLHDQEMLPDVQNDGSPSERSLANGAGDDASLPTLQNDDGDGGDFLDPVTDKYRCETCGVNLDSLRRFMDHRNFECVAGLDEAATALIVGGTAHSEVTGGTSAMETENSMESDLNGTPSWRSDTPDDQSLSPSSCCATPPDPDVELSGTVGVTENTPYACQFCERAFPRLSYLKRHEQSHGDQMPFKCDFCHRLFKHKRSRDRHVKLHTGDKKYRCPHCEAAFSRSDHLKIHMKTHDNAKPFQCTTCNRGYNTAAALTSHMQNHKKDSATSNVQKIRCLRCSAFFPTAQQLQTHILGHHSDECSLLDKMTQCNYCQHVCSGFDALAVHMDVVHPGENQSRCPTCGEVTASLESLHEHLKVHGEGGVGNEEETNNRKDGLKLSCVYCTKNNFATEEVLQLHVQAMHGGAVLTNGDIPASPSASVSPASIMAAALAVAVPFAHQQASRSSSSVGFSCEYCTMKFASVQALQKHTLTVHSFTEVIKAGGKEMIFCSHCTMIFPNANLLAEHTKLVHGVTSPSGQGTNSATKMSPTTKESSKSGRSSKNSAADCGSGSGKDVKVNGDHQFTHPGTLLCNQCNAAFPDFESFRTHLKTHLDEVIQKYVCGECQGEFGSEEQLDGHIVTHYASTTTEYGCQCCLKLFSKPDELQKHLMDIHAHHLYRCSLCKEMFDSKVSIQVHFAVKHSNECKLFKCTACNSVFRSEMEFQLHVKVAHLRQVKPFRCLFCNLSFAAELELQCHLMSHKKQFACTLCDEAFHVEFLLDKHMQTKHSSSTETNAENTNDLPATSTDNNASSASSPAPASKNKAKPSGAAVAASNGAATGSSSVGGVVSASSSSSSTCGSMASTKKETKCDICDVDLCSDTALTAHRKQVHNIKTSQKGGSQQTLSLYCAYCNEACKSRTELENHMKVHTLSSSKHKCNICDEVCPTASILAEHKLTHCKVVSGSLCVVCKVNLKSEDQYYSHLQQHNSQGIPLPCVVCRQTLMSEIEVQMHAKFHLKNAEPLFPCCCCLKQLELNNLVVSSTGNSQQTYVCKECFHNNTSNRNTPTSTAVGNAGDEIRCGECKVKFESELDLEAHQRVHQKTYQCIKCQMSFGTEAEIQMHVASHMLHEGINHECRLCHKVFDSPAKLQCHLIEHTFEGCPGYTCYMCSAVFTTALLIQQHMLEHGLNSRPYDCTHCHQKFFFRSELENHIFSHCHERMITTEESGQFKCPECLRTFSTALHLSNHRKLHQHAKSRTSGSNGYKCSSSSSTSNTEDSSLSKRPPFRCSECGQDFPCLSNLQGHMRLHTHGTKFTCPECSKEFALSRNLNIHMRLHSGEKPYECPMCKKRFARKENRKAHLKSHSGVKPFTCPHCGKSFSRKCHVKEHMRLHEAPSSCSPSPVAHTCEFCPESFTTIEAMQRHLTDVHPRSEREYACKLCDDRFLLLKNLTKHVRRFHTSSADNTTASGGEGRGGSSAASSPDHSSSSTAMDVKDMDTCECSSSGPEESGSSREPSPSFDPSIVVGNVEDGRSNSTSQEVMACQ